ncbi:MAG: bifunctional aspartate kinase/diaminopimelate decarboxylase [Acidobacteriota bacterium]
MSKPWIVLKFGGTSVATAERWRTIASRVNELRPQARVVVVASALSGVSDLLERALREARRGEPLTALDEIRTRHEDLADAIGNASNERAQVRSIWDDVARRLEGVRLTGEASPRLTARVMAAGELASTTLGVAALRTHGTTARWLDARELLVTVTRPHQSDESRFLEAVVDPCCDRERFDRAAAGSEIVLTQGFIAANHEKETCLLGRGGSDTSGALIAVLAGAERLEIWTDVHGLFTADPRSIPAARLIRRIGYREAQEIAAMGAKVLHPRCLPPVARFAIPLLVKNTLDPAAEGTLITIEHDDEPAVTAVAWRRNITLLSIETMAMWETPGFLAQVFAPFQDLGISVDLVATSQAAVTITLDKIPGGIDGAPAQALIARLQALGSVRVAHSCAAISIVGRRIRAALPELASALSAFAERSVHLFSQSSEDLNVSFVVDEDDAPAIVERLHAALLPAQGDDQRFGPTWEMLQGWPIAKSMAESPWWLRRRTELLALTEDGRARYVYDRATVRERAQQLLRTVTQVDAFYYAMKANSHRELLATIVEAGFGLECVSAGELLRAKELVDGRAPLLFTPNLAPIAEYALAFESGAEVTVDGPHTLAIAPEMFRGTSLALRLDPGQGLGHHEKVRTAGAHAKFGHPIESIDEFCEAAARLDIRVVGLHAHVGSGIFDAGAWATIGTTLGALRERFEHLAWIDLGGGLGVPDRPGRAPLDLERLNQSLAPLRHWLGSLQLRLEPGRYLVSEAGVLLAPVTQVRRKRGVGFVGVSTGMNSLLRPALYGAWHTIHNLSRWGQAPAGYWHIAGPICESGDLLGRDRLLPESQPGDVLLIENAGAYGAAMSSRYNLREPAEECVI